MTAHMYEMSNLHRKQLPTEDVVKIKYASLIIYLKEKQPVFFFLIYCDKTDRVWLQPWSAGSITLAVSHPP